MRLAVILVSIAAEVVAWRVVARGRASEWNLMLGLLAAQGAAALIVWPVALSPKVSGVVAAAVGAAAGAALFGGTLVFVALAARWPRFGAQVVDRYRRAGQLPLGLAIALTLAIAVPGEELFWRGFVQPFAQAHTPVLSGPALAWAGYVGVNAASGSLPFVAGAVVGGALWGALALWTGGVLAALVCHGVWTTLMLAFPPAAGRGGAGAGMMSA